MRTSVTQGLHGFLQVGIEASHAAGEEGVHHAPREVAAEVGLEERDQVGLVGLPGETGAEPRHAPGAGHLERGTGAAEEHSPWETRL